MKRFYLAAASGLGTGFLRPASGTWGTLVGIPIVLLLPNTGWFWYGLITLLVFMFGVKAAAAAEAHWQEKDSSKIVIDEIVGYMIAMYQVPVSCHSLFWAFVLFRFFDIVKIWPARRIDQSNGGGWSVMADDAAAGLYTNLVMLIIVSLGWLK